MAKQFCRIAYGANCWNRTRNLPLTMRMLCLVELSWHIKRPGFWYGILPTVYTGPQFKNRQLRIVKRLAGSTLSLFRAPGDFVWWNLMDSDHGPTVYKTATLTI